MNSQILHNAMGKPKVTLSRNLLWPANIESYYLKIKRKKKWNLEKFEILFFETRSLTSGPIEDAQKAFHKNGL